MDTLFFIRKLIQGTILNPLFLLCFIVVAGTLLARWKDRRPSNLAITAALCIVLPLIFPIADWVTAPLEQRFERPSLDESAPPDAIVVLGGAIGAQRSRWRDDVVLSDAAERLTTGASLAIKFPQAQLIFSSHPAEVYWARQFWLKAGIKAEQIVLDATALTTATNARGVAELLVPEESRVLLVTSAKHMPRSVGAFLSRGFTKIMPYPTDYRTPYRSLTSVTGNWQLITESFREWLGLVVYWLNNDSDYLYPGPQHLESWN